MAHVLRRVTQVLEHAQRNMGSCQGRKTCLMPAIIMNGPKAVFCIVEVCGLVVGGKHMYQLYSFAAPVTACFACTGHQCKQPPCLDLAVGLIL
jgi:hypothetical protein